MKTAEHIIQEKGGTIISVAPETTIHDALSIMTEHRIGAILVRDGDDIQGIWTERDLMKNTLDSAFDAPTALVKNHMTRNLQTAPHDATIFHLLDNFLGKRIRHLLIEKEGSLIGLISQGDVVKANLVEKTKEVKELTEMVSWDYYENWRWKGDE